MSASSLTSPLPHSLIPHSLIPLIPHSPKKRRTVKCAPKTTNKTARQKNAGSLTRDSCARRDVHDVRHRVLRDRHCHGDAFRRRPRMSADAAPVDALRLP